MQLEAAHAVEITKLAEYVDRKEDPLLLLLLLLLTAIELSLGGSNPYTSTNKTNKNKCA